MKDRIRQIMEAKHLNQQSFASLIGISTASLSSIYSDRTKPTLNTVAAIKKTFPEINTDWLLSGVGEMISNHAAVNPTSPEEGLQKTHALPNVTPTLSGRSLQGASSAQEQVLDFDSSSTMPQNRSYESTPHYGVNRTLNSVPHIDAKIIDKPQRKITEIRIFYDDQTWETFVPKNK